MRAISAVLAGIALLGLACVQPAAALYSKRDDVIEVTDAKFKDEVTKADGVVAVEFYAP